MKLFVFYYLPLFLYLIVVFMLNIVPVQKSFISISNVDKLVHFLMFSILAWLCYRTLEYIHREKTPLFIPFVMLCACAVINESSQILIPGRHPCFYDFIANMVGITSVFIIYFIRKHTVFAK
ncbi:MAG: VanZ family protein [bacterium]